MAETRKLFVMDQMESQSSILAQASWIAAFTGLTALGAQIEIPHQPIPFTLQTFFVLLSGAFLGARNGALSQAAYIALGALGLPVFSGASFGLAKIFGPTGGYLLSFPIAAAIVGYLVSLRKGYVWTLASMFAALLILFTIGSLYLDVTYVHDLQQAFASGFLIFSWWDILKLSAAAAIYNELSKKFRRLPT